MYGTRRILVSCLWLLSLAVLGAPAPSVTARVERVIDGDTIVVARVGTVPLIGVDTPETVDPRKPVQHFEREAADFTKLLVDRVTVRLELEGIGQG